MTPFIVFAMPRSRSAWLSRLLSYGDVLCGHDELRHCRSLDDVASWFAQPSVGSVETAAAPFWRLAPPARYVTLRRPVDAVLASLRAGGLAFEDAVMLPHLQHLEHKLDQIERRLPDVLAVTFDELEDEAVCARVFEHCLGQPHDHAWWQHWNNIRIDISLPHQMHYYWAHKPQFDRLTKIAVHRSKAKMRQAPREFDGMEIGVEPFDVWYRDAASLLAEHSVLVGEAPDYGQLANAPLCQRLDELGMLHITTARSNGLMFGYLMTILSPSLEYRDRMIATHTTFYASPDVRGLGMRLQRAARDTLRERGISEIQMRAGVRGDGPRLGVMYRRMGAVPAGELYRLEL